MEKPQRFNSCNWEIPHPVPSGFVRLPGGEHFTESPSLNVWLPSAGFARRLVDCNPNKKEMIQEHALTKEIGVLFSLSKIRDFRGYLDRCLFSLSSWVISSWKSYVYRCFSSILPTQPAAIAIASGIPFDCCIWKNPTSVLSFKPEKNIDPMESNGIQVTTDVPASSIHNMTRSSPFATSL